MIDIEIGKIDSFKDILGKNIKVGDVVLYPRSGYTTPEMTLAKVTNIEQLIDHYKRKYLRVDVNVFDGSVWKLREKYPDSKAVVYFYKTSLTASVSNLVKIDPSELTELEYDVLVDEIEVPIYKDYVTIRTEGKQYNIEDIKKVTGENSNNYFTT